MDSLNPFMLVLSGLPSLQDRLSIGYAQPLNQRVVMRYTMEPLEKQEVREYVEFNLETAGARQNIFGEDALEAIASLSRGWPRLINNLCMNCLLLGTQAEKNPIDGEVVRLAALESGL